MSVCVCCPESFSSSEMLIGFHPTLETLKWVVSLQPWGVTAHRTSPDDERPNQWPAMRSHLCILTRECVHSHESVCVLMCACGHLCLCATSHYISEGGGLSDGCVSVINNLIYLAHQLFIYCHEFLPKCVQQSDYS